METLFPGSSRSSAAASDAGSGVATVSRKPVASAATETATKAPQTTVANLSGESGGGGESDGRVAAARQGDRKAFEALLAEARPRALCVAMKVLHNPDDAEDAVQDGFLKAWRNLGRFEGRSAFSTWIHRIVMNSSLDLLRRQACRPGSCNEDADLDLERATQADAVHTDTPEREAQRSELRVVVAEALATLSPAHREVVTLRELEEYSYEEIATSAACPIGTVMSRLHHARHRLADELKVVLGQEAALLAA